VVVSHPFQGITIFKAVKKKTKKFLFIFIRFDSYGIAMHGPVCWWRDKLQVGYCTIYIYFFFINLLLGEVNLKVQKK
jgi:hypothetical protein